MTKKEEIAALKAKIAELEKDKEDPAPPADPPAGSGESYSLTEKDLQELIDKRIKEIQKALPATQPGFVPNPNNKGKPMHRVLEMKR